MKSYSKFERHISATGVNFVYVKIILKNGKRISSGCSKSTDAHLCLTLSWRISLSYRNQSTDLQTGLYMIRTSSTKELNGKSLKTYLKDNGRWPYGKSKFCPQNNGFNIVSPKELQDINTTFWNEQTTMNWQHILVRRRILRKSGTLQSRKNVRST